MIRVLRLLEYRYPNGDDMVADMARWSVPPVGVSPHNWRNMIVSTTLDPEVLDVKQLQDEAIEKMVAALVAGDMVANESEGRAFATICSNALTTR